MGAGCRSRRARRRRPANTSAWSCSSARPALHELERRGRRAFNESLEASRYGTRIEPVALPRKFRYVDEIPVDAQGKRQQATLKELFKTR